MPVVQIVAFPGYAEGIQPGDEGFKVEALTERTFGLRIDMNDLGHLRGFRSLRRSVSKDRSSSVNRQLGSFSMGNHEGKGFTG